MRRRDFVAGTIAACALAAAPRRAFARSPRRPPRRPPHYVIRIVLAGGVDTLLTIDPKDATEVGAHIDCGYRPDERVAGGARLFGPAIGGLLRHEAKLCLVRGVRVDTLNHTDAQRVLHTGHVLSSPSTPLFGDLLGAALPGDAPIAHLYLGPPNHAGPVSPAGRRIVYLPPPLVARAQGYAPPDRPSPLPPIDRSPSAWHDLLVEAHAAQASRLFGARSDALRESVASEGAVSSVRGLLAGLDPTPRFRDLLIGPQLQVAAHAVRHDLAKFIHVACHANWFDSHSNNFPTQMARLPSVMEAIATLIDLLGPRLEQTTIVVGSELGRFPTENAARGKDHWPETSWILAGKGVRAATTLGATDERMRGAAVDYRTGSTVTGDRRPILIDALSATLFAIAGAPPQAHGFERDAVLEAILA